MWKVREENNEVKLYASVRTEIRFETKLLQQRHSIKTKQIAKQTILEYETWEEVKEERRTTITGIITNQSNSADLIMMMVMMV